MGQGRGRQRQLSIMAPLLACASAGASNMPYQLLHARSAKLKSAQARHKLSPAQA